MPEEELTKKEEVKKSRAQKAVSGTKSQDSSSKISRTKEKAKRHAKEFRDEFNKTIKTAFIAAFGFLIALVWRDLITEYVNKISESSPVSGKLISALIITLICVLGIMILTKLLSKKDGEKK